MNAVLDCLEAKYKWVRLSSLSGLLWWERFVGGVALPERCVSRIGKLLTSSWICAGLLLRRAAMRLIR